MDDQEECHRSTSLRSKGAIDQERKFPKGCEGTLDNGRQRTSYVQGEDDGGVHGPRVEGKSARRKGISSTKRG